MGRGWKILANISFFDVTLYVYTVVLSLTNLKTDCCRVACYPHLPLLLPNFYNLFQEDKFNITEYQNADIVELPYKVGTI